MKLPVIHLTSKDFVTETFRCGGKGGQHQNKTNSGVRIKHPESGAVAESREERSQLQNKKIAFKRLTDSDVFKKWLKLEHNRRLGNLPSDDEILKQVDKTIERDLKNGNIKIESFKSN